MVIIEGGVVRTLILLTLMVFSSAVFSLQPGSGEGRICAPFRGVVDPLIVGKMLKADKEGRLFHIQTKNSKVGFCVDSIIGRVEARFGEIKGGLALHRKVWGNDSQMLVMVDANSLAVNRDFLREMLTGEYFLDTYTYPKILFVSTGLHWLSHEKAILKGMLTMHGVTRLVYFNVTMLLLPNRTPRSFADVVVTASTFIKRTDFNMHSLLFVVDETVELCMRIEATLFKK